MSLLEPWQVELEEDHIVYEVAVPPPEHPPVWTFRPRPITPNLGICGCDAYKNAIPLPGTIPHTPCNGELHDPVVLNIYQEFCRNHDLDHWYLCSPEGESK